MKLVLVYMAAGCFCVSFLFVSATIIERFRSMFRSMRGWIKLDQKLRIYL